MNEKTENLLKTWLDQCVHKEPLWLEKTTILWDSFRRFCGYVPGAPYPTAIKRGEFSAWLAEQGYPRVKYGYYHRQQGLRVRREVVFDSPEI